LIGKGNVKTENGRPNIDESTVWGIKWFVKYEPRQRGKYGD
jgi:hypothetical protein